MPSAGRWVVAVVVVLGLALPAAAVARPADAVQSAAKLRSIGSLPQRAFAGDDFRLAVKVRNDSRKAARPRLVVSLRTAQERLGRPRRRLPARGQAQGGGEQALQGQGRAAERIGRRPVLRVRVRSYRRAAELPDGGPAAQGHEAASQKPPKPPDPKPDDKRADVLVLTESRTAADAHSSTAAGLDALKDAGKERELQGRRRRRSRRARSPRPVSRATAWSCSSTRRATSSATTSSRRSSTSSRQGGGFVAIHSAITTEPDWTFMNRLLGTRAEPGTPPVSRESTQQAAAIKVADRVHDASKSMAERFAVTDAFYNTRPRPPNVRGRAARAGDGRRGLVRRAGRHPDDDRRSPGHVVPGLRGWPLVLHGPGP